MCTGDRTPSLNPQHTVPVLVDGGTIITESRAAMTYLVMKHNAVEMYPDCPKKRSQIDMRHVGVNRTPPSWEWE